MHVGDGAWVLVDSCGRADAPAALHYLGTLGIDPADAAKLIVATHWHDDHIRGIAHMASICNTASFCCAAALRAEEFLAAIHELEHRHFAAFGSGVQEIYKLFSRHREKGAVPTWALANRRVFSSGACHIWSLSQGQCRRARDTRIRYQTTKDTGIQCRSTATSDCLAHALEG